MGMVIMRHAFFFIHAPPLPILNVTASTCRRNKSIQQQQRNKNVVRENMTIFDKLSFAPKCRSCHIFESGCLYVYLAACACVCVLFPLLLEYPLFWMQYQMWWNDYHIIAFNICCCCRCCRYWILRSTSLDIPSFRVCYTIRSFPCFWILKITWFTMFEQAFKAPDIGITVLLVH